jgi:drug/metabolite transporter (DMT)-like permease
VRVYAQFYFLSHTSATTLSLSNLAIQALTIVLGILLFGTHVTPLLALGVAVTTVMSGVYTWLKVFKLPQLQKAQEKEEARAAQVFATTSRSDVEMAPVE